MDSRRSRSLQLNAHHQRVYRHPQHRSNLGPFPTANYGFDDRMEFVRPPFHPLLVNDWSYEDWTEVPLPAWAGP